MTSLSPALHYVCTLEQARDLVAHRTRFWVCTCGCRAGRGHCEQSRSDVCVQFVSGPSSGPNLRECSREQVHEVLREAEDTLLVARPFRTADRAETEGICFCCGDCCGYFLDPTEPCDKGSLIELTDVECCTNCGICVEACRFKARYMEGEKLVVDRAKCWGCGLCATACPIRCIEMIDQ